jgi:hypothetical protein
MIHRSNSVALIGLTSILCACGGGSSTQPPPPAGSCVAGQTCTPTTADPCHTHQTACDSTLTQITCAAGAALPDGTECGSAQACSSGACVASATRRVSGTLSTTYLRDDGTRESRAGWDGDIALGSTVTALLVPAASDPTGYQTFPVEVAGDGTFAVGGVPFGTYFIQVDVTGFRNVTTTVPGGGQSTTTVIVVERMLFEASAGSPDLSIAVSKRPDAAVASLGTAPDVQFQLAGLNPLATRDAIRLTSSDSNLNASFTRSFFATPPAAGATSIDASANWAGAGGVLPDASQGDVTWVLQRRSQAVSPGATLLNAVTFAKVTDFTVRDGVGGTLSATMTAAPQTGIAPSDMRWSQFAALAPAVHPGGTPSSDTAPFIGFEVVPQTIDFPDEPIQALQTSPLSIDPFFATTQTEFPQGFFPEATFDAAVPSAADVNYGTVAYGQVFDSVWHRAAQVFYEYDAPLATATTPLRVTDAGLYRAFVPLDLLSNPVVPQLGPPASPLINGADAFAFHSGVGAQPTLSWSAPALGTATKYMVTVAPLKAFQTNDIASVTAVLYDQMSFKLPADTLDPTLQYYATITAVQSPDRIDDPILRLGSPTYMANTVIGLFQP